MTGEEISFDDYEPLDGVDDGMIDCCGRCEQSFHPNDYRGEIVRRDGTRYDHLSDTDPMDRPFFCPDCYAAIDAAERASEHQTLEAFQR